MSVLRAPLTVLVCMMVAALPSRGRATHVTDLASAFDEGDVYDFNLQVGYQRSLERGAIKREFAYYPDRVHLVKDLRFSQIRHVLSVRAEAAIWRDLQLHVEFPIVVSDKRWLDFAQNGGDACTTPSGKQLCVNKGNSLTVGRDNMLPASLTAAMETNQVSVAGPDGGRLNRDGSWAGPPLLDLPVRSGLDQMYLGLSWAPLNQERDSTKPTWVVGFEARISIGDPMRYNPYFNANVEADDLLNPASNSSVGRGIHQYHWWTSISKRYRYIDPWFSLFYMLPQATDDSLFKKSAFDLSGQERSGPRHRGGVEMGLEIVPWEVPKKKHKFTIELAARLEGVFEGRGYSPAWEIFANNPLLAGPCQAGDDPTGSQKWFNGTYCANAGQTIPFPGITNIENHFMFKGALAFNLDITSWFRTRLGVALGHEQDHYITFGDAGKDLNNNGIVDPNVEEEVNPMFRPYIDGPGRRYRVEDSTLFDFFVSAEGRF